jgi:hypothetical protein
MSKAHDRKLGLLGVSLTSVRPPRKCIGVRSKVRDEIEAVMIQSEYLKGAPFEWITLALRYGLNKDDEPIYLGIDKKTGDLELAIGVDTDAIRSADESELKEIFSEATLKALIHAGERYSLNNKGLIEHSR